MKRKEKNSRQKWWALLFLYNLFSLVFFFCMNVWLCVCVCMWGKLRFCPAFHSLFICWYHICIYCTIFESFSCSTGLSRNLWKSSGSYRFSLKMVMVCKWINFFLPIWIIMQVTPGKKNTYNNIANTIYKLNYGELCAAKTKTIITALERSK